LIPKKTSDTNFGQSLPERSINGFMHKHLTMIKTGKVIASGLGSGRRKAESFEVRSLKNVEMKPE